MNTQNIRFFLLAALALVGTMLYTAWEKEHLPPNVVTKTQTVDKQAAAQSTADKDIPILQEEKTPGEKLLLESPAERQVEIKTDVLNLTIDKQGGDIIRLVLPTYAEEHRAPSKQGYVLFDHTAKRYYIAQSGLAGEQGPDQRGVGRALYETKQSVYQLEQNELSVDFKTRTKEGVDIIKRFTFQRGSYVIGVEYLIFNQGKSEYKGSFYTRLRRKADTDSGSSFFGVQTFTGAAVYTPETPYTKITFKDIQEKPLDRSIQGGWAAMVEHYFVSAWIPPTDITSVYQTSKIEGDIYNVGFVEPTVTVLPGEEKSIKARLYAGPEIRDTLNSLAPGLDLVVDYGILWPISEPIFWVLKKLYHYTGNWGVAIILITVLIKLLFYKLSASSYRSMGNMRKLQPKLEALKERYGDDKQKYSQAVMELYKKEKINPLGGCLPIVIQIPVFIALYYVLLGSVELREAPFALWITDLSDKDPYYVLPVLMGISMFVQQRLNPAPPDPVQAKVMMFMPVIFTFLFMNFPSGLVLYWLVNNVLSIVQQWYITRKIERSAKPHGAK